MPNDATKLTKEIITNSQTAISTYKTTVTAQVAELEKALNDLFASGFIGDAAEGYEHFYSQKIKPALTTNLTEEGATSLMGALNKMMEDIGQQFLQNVDPALGKANQGAGSQN